MAAAQQGRVDESATVAFSNVQDVPTFSIKAPTVIEVPVAGGDWERSQFAVYDVTAGVFVPNLVRQTIIYKTVPVVATAFASLPVNVDAVIDNDLKSFTQFDLPASGIGMATITLTSAEPITSNALSTFLDEFVALPTSIEIKAVVGGSEKIVIARQAMPGRLTQFPKTTASVWRISFTYGQPLRITELRLGQEKYSSESTRSVRFLGQINHLYRVYSNADRPASIPTGEMPNLSSNQDVLRLNETTTRRPNPFYRMADSDSDGIPDLRDNCVQLANTDQVDVDANGRGDACDDFDRDGRLNANDNCLEVTNAAQTDTDVDGIGDACDGEESRITEKHAWLPWVGIGFAGVILVFLLAHMAITMRKGTPGASADDGRNDGSQ
jgi:hypothetical protein